MFTLTTLSQPNPYTFCNTTNMFHHRRGITCFSMFKIRKSLRVASQFTALDSVFRKKGTFHDEQLGKTKNLANSYFCFSNCYHTNFWAIASMIFIFNTKHKSWQSWIAPNIVKNLIQPWSALHNVQFNHLYLLQFML